MLSSAKVDNVHCQDNIRLDPLSRRVDVKDILYRSPHFQIFIGIFVVKAIKISRYLDKNDLTLIYPHENLDITLKFSSENRKTLKISKAF